MLPIFTQGQGPRGAISNSPNLPNFRRLSEGAVAQQRSYYASNVRAVDSDHPFVQLINHMPDWSTDTITLADTAVARYPYLSRNLRFTTDFNKGSFKEHKVYSLEDNMIYATSEYISPYTAVDNWQSLQPVKVIWMDSNKIDLSTPDGGKRSQPGFVAMSVDVPRLILMYKGYKASEFKRTNGQLLLGPQQFVATYLLPSMIPSQLDASCISSLIALHNGEYETISRVDSPIYIPSRGTEFKDIAKHTLNRLKDSRMQYNHMLQQFPTVFSANGSDFLQLPDYAPTTQVEWAMLVTRLKVIEFMIDLGGKQGRDTNRGFITKLKTYCRDVQMSKIPYLVMSDNLARNVDDALTRIKKLK